MMGDHGKNQNDRLSADEQFRRDLQSSIRNFNKQEFEDARLDEEISEYIEKMNAIKSIIKNILREEIAYWQRIQEIKQQEESKEKADYFDELEKKQLESLEQDLSQLYDELDQDREQLQGFIDDFAQAEQDFFDAIEARSERVKELETVRNNIVKDLFSDKEKLLDALTEAADDNFNQEDLEIITDIISNMDDETVTQCLASLDAQENGVSQSLMNETGSDIPPIPSDDRLAQNASAYPADLLARVVKQKMIERGYKNDNLDHDKIKNLLGKTIASELDQNIDYQEALRAVAEATDECKQAQAKMNDLGQSITATQERLQQKQARYETMLRDNPRLLELHSKLEKNHVIPRLSREVARQKNDTQSLRSAVEKFKSPTRRGPAMRTNRAASKTSPKGPGEQRSLAAGQVTILRQGLHVIDSKRILIKNPSLGTRKKPGSYSLTDASGKRVYSDDSNLTKSQEALLNRQSDIENGIKRSYDEFNQKFIQQVQSILKPDESVKLADDTSDYKAIYILGEDGRTRPLNTEEKSLYQTMFRSEMNDIAKNVFKSDPNLQGLKVNVKIPTPYNPHKKMDSERRTIPGGVSKLPTLRNRARKSGTLPTEPMLPEGFEENDRDDVLGLYKEVIDRFKNTLDIQTENLLNSTSENRQENYDALVSTIEKVKAEIDEINRDESDGASPQQVAYLGRLSNWSLSENLSSHNTVLSSAKSILATEKHEEMAKKLSSEPEQDDTPEYGQDSDSTFRLS